jgi:hypothetical protein
LSCDAVTSTTDHVPLSAGSVTELIVPQAIPAGPIKVGVEPSAERK